MIGGVSGGFDPSSIFSSKRPDATDISNRIMQKGDENGDGAISKAEFEKSLSQAQGVDKDRAQQRFDKLDKNSDGSIDQAELQSGIEEKMQMMKAKMAAMGISGAMANMFIGQYDDDEDERFSPVSSLLDALQGSSTASDPMAKGDTNADGALNKEEFNSLLSAMGNGRKIDENKAGKAFDKVDSNGDGKISQLELDNIQERIKASMLMARQSQVTLQENQDQLSKLAIAMKQAYTSSIEGLGSSDAKDISNSLSVSA